MGSERESSSAPGAIDSTNVGFKLLKKCGWKEGMGLGVSEQGRLEPLEPQVKNNKSGIGAEKVKMKMKQLSGDRSSESSNRKQDPLQAKKKTKLASKRLRKMLEEEERMKERAFQQAFFREFWPDNV